MTAFLDTNNRAGVLGHWWTFHGRWARGGLG